MQCMRASDWSRLPKSTFLAQLMLVLRSSGTDCAIATTSARDRGLLAPSSCRITRTPVCTRLWYKT